MQPHHQTVLTSGGLVQPHYVSQPYHSASVVNQYGHRQSTVVGILLFIAGSLSVIANIVDLGIGTSAKWPKWDQRQQPQYYGGRYYDNYVETSLSEKSNGVNGHGLWCGAIIIIAGGFGIGAARHKTRCMINAFMVFAIIGTVFAVIQLSNAAIGAIVVRDLHLNFIAPSKVITVFVMEVLMAVLGGCAFALCLWGSILCCATGGCCCCSYQQPAVFTAMPAGHPQVTVLTQQQMPMQPIVMDQPPPYYQQPVVYPAPPQYAETPPKA